MEFPLDFDFSQCVKKAEDVIIRELDGESVLLNLDSEIYFGLDDVGTRMWTHLTTSTSIQAAFEMLRKEYNVDTGQLRNDLGELLRELFESGLLVLADSETG